MKIKELYIRSFGKLKEYKLSLSDGLNVLFGNNEAGKTTIFNFILAMLYGFSNTRGKGIADSARKKYMTWGENKIGGTMTVEYNGVTYVIDRTFGKTKSGDSLSLTNLTIGEQINLPGGKEVGEYFFDLDEKSFKGTCFIGQLSREDVCDNDSVRTKLSNLSSVGDAEYSFDDVFGRLKSASLEITRNTATGKKYPLEIKKNELESRNRTIESELRQISLIDDENREFDEKRTALLSKLSVTESRIDGAKAKQKALEYKKAFENNKRVEEANAQYKKSTDSITRKGFTADRGYVDTLNSLIKRRDDARLKYEYEVELLENEKKALEIAASSKSEKKKTVMISHLIGTIILAGLFAAALVLNIISLAIMFGIGTIVSCVLLVYSVVNKKRLQSKDIELATQWGRISSVTAQVDRLESEYIQCDEQFYSKFLLFFEREQINDAQENINALSAMVNRCVESKIRYDAIVSSAVSQQELAQMREGIDESCLNGELVAVDVAELETQRAMIANEISPIEKTLLVNKERVKGKGKLEAELENNLSEIAEIAEKINAYKYAGECLELAKQGLEKAQAQMQQQFAPDVSRLVSEILGQLTCGKYSQMTLNNSLKAMIVDNESGAAYDDDYMSAGTLDQIYLALRLAMVELIFSDKEYPIICMDDALLNFDSSRMEKAAEYISTTLSKKAQVIFFTCRNTEKGCFSDSNLIDV